MKKNIAIIILVVFCIGLFLYSFAKKTQEELAHAEAIRNMQYAKELMLQAKEEAEKQEKLILELKQQLLDCKKAK
ncbi:MAG: hypothetical protein KDC58_10310 [Cyclobacteriaceae bacterium]|nr:hypothetical protein [Cyclobacteriaceae bacterium]